MKAKTKNTNTSQENYEKALAFLAGAQKVFKSSELPPVIYNNNQYLLREKEANNKKAAFTNQQSNHAPPPPPSYPQKRQVTDEAQRIMQKYNPQAQHQNRPKPAAKVTLQYSESFEPQLPPHNFYESVSEQTPTYQNYEPQYSRQKNNNNNSSFQNVMERMNSETQKSSSSNDRSNNNEPRVRYVEPQATKIPTKKNYEKGDYQKWANDPRVPDVQLYRVLKDQFKIKEFRNNQKAIIKATMLERDVFVCMPTGGGKSLTFQVPASMEPGVTLCIMPLVSLIYDQQIQCRMTGLKGYSLTGNSKASEVNLVMDLLEQPHLSHEVVIFSTPEKMCQSQRSIDALTVSYRNGTFKRIVIDEVHCVSTWGRDFRKDYENLGFLKKKFPKVPLLALTATATEKVIEDIINRLNIRGCLFFQSSFNRTNLYYEVRPKNSKSKGAQQIIQLVREKFPNQSGIIYCCKKKECEELTDVLNKGGIRAAFYHAGIDDNVKKGIQDQWMNNQIRIIVATIAFGMGINKPDVRFVIHHSISKSLENYYQQSGRAGRDGAKASCILFYSRGDRNSFEFMNLRNEYSTHDTKDYNQKKLSDMIRYAQDLFNCRRVLQLGYFGEHFDKVQCQDTCDNCILKRQWDEIECGHEVQNIVIFLESCNIKKETLTLNQIVEIAKSGGMKKKNNKFKFFDKKGISFDILSSLKNWDKKNLELLLIDLLCKEVLVEKVVRVGERHCTYIYPYICKQFAAHQNPPEYFLKVEKKKARIGKPVSPPEIEEEQEMPESYFDEDGNAFGMFDLSQFKNETSSLAQSDEPRVDPDYDQDAMDQLMNLLNMDKEKKLKERSQQLMEFLEELDSFEA